MSHPPVAQVFVLAAFMVGIHRDQIWPAKYAQLDSWLICFALMIAAGLEEMR